MPPTARTVAEYLAQLPPERRVVVAAVRDVIRRNLDADYEEGMQHGMISWHVPHRVFPAGYHCDPSKPLAFASLAAQKGGYSLHLMSVYGCDGAEPSREASWFRDAWLASGKKLDMGRACVRFKRLEDVALEVVGEAIRRVPAARFVERYLAALGEHVASRGQTKATSPARGGSAKPKGRSRGR